MRFILLLIPFFSAASLFTQTFELTYSTDQDDRLWNVFENEDGDIFCVGHIAEPESSKFRGLILKLDPQGEAVDQKIIDIPNRTFDLYRILQDTLGALILCGKTCDTTYQQLHTRLEIITIDYDLNVIDSASYLLDNEKWLGGMAAAIGKNSDLLFGMGMTTNEPPYSYMFFARLNSQLDSLLFRQIDPGYIDQIKQLNDSTYWAVTTAGNYSFTLLDSLFNIKEIKPVPRSLVETYGLKWDSDTSFFIAGDWNGGIDYNIGIIRHHDPMSDPDHLFTSWGDEDIWDLTAPNGGLDFINKDSVYVGVISPFYPWLNFPSDYVLIQTDSLLNIRWERFYGHGDYYYELINIHASNDGGCILAGTRYDYGIGIKERDIYIVKVDGEGLVVGNVETPSIQMHEAIVYPNPGTTEVKVRIAAQYQESLFQLFDMNGKQVASENIIGKWGTINTSFLKSGTYVYMISSEDGLFETGKWIKK